MIRPPDIPEAAWNAAVKCGETVLRNLPDDYGDVTAELVVIARAIMAAKAEERAGCIAAAEAERDDAACGEGEVYIADKIITAIRKRGEG